jgi:hypothetical protein
LDENVQAIKRWERAILLARSKAWLTMFLAEQLGCRITSSSLFPAILFLLAGTNLSFASSHA